MIYFFIIFGIYLFVVFVLSRLVIPFMGFGMYKIPVELPETMSAKIKELEAQSISAEEFLRKVYEFVQNRWHAERLKTVIKLLLVFRTDLNKIYNTPGYAHCNTINYVFVSMLANSRFFKPQDLRVKHVFFNGVPHQFVQVNLYGKVLDLDPSLYYVKGVPFGQRTKKLFG